MHNLSTKGKVACISDSYWFSEPQKWPKTIKMKLIAAPYGCEEGLHFAEGFLIVIPRPVCPLNLYLYFQKKICPLSLYLYFPKKSMSTELVFVLSKRKYVHCIFICNFQRKVYPLNLYLHFQKKGMSTRVSHFYTFF